MWHNPKATLCKYFCRFVNVASVVGWEVHGFTFESVANIP